MQLMLLNDLNDENNTMNAIMKREDDRIFLSRCSMASEAPQVAA